MKIPCILLSRNDFNLDPHHNFFMQKLLELLKRDLPAKFMRGDLVENKGVKNNVTLTRRFPNNSNPLRQADLTAGRALKA